MLIGPVSSPAQAAFTSLYIFGDSISTTTNNPSPGSSYFGKRYTNGRVWVEVLAERQGLTYISNRNWSYFGHTSTALVTNVNSFTAPGDASTGLYIIWVNNADLYNPATSSTPSNMALWTNTINLSQTNHFRAITNLYAKGVRTLILPNVVDLSTIPLLNNSPHTNFFHLRCIDYNIAFTNTLNRSRTSCPAMTIYAPDMFSLLANILAYPVNYGVTNALLNGKSIDVISDHSLANKSTNGPGTNYIFWTYQDPTAKVHVSMADLAQQLISPVQISNLTLLAGSNQLDVVNVPIGRNGFVDGSSNLAGWASEMNIDSTNATQSMFVPASGPIRFYRLRFPFAWSWP